MSKKPKKKDQAEEKDVPPVDENEETPTEASEEEAGEETPEVEEEEILDPLEKAEAERDENADQLLRARAELDNFRKRAAREKQDAVRLAGGSVIRDLLPVLDSFQMGLEMARTEDENSMIFKGMDMVAGQFSDFFENNGVTVVNPEGEKFDPEQHDAMAQEPSDDVEEGIIIRVMRAGYVLQERLLRPASVVVSSGPPKDEEEEVEEIEEVESENGEGDDTSDTETEEEDS